MCPVLRAYYYPLTSGLFIPLLMISYSSYCAELPSVQQSIHQQERQRALEERLSPSAPDVRLSEPTASLGRLVFPLEQPCFAIDSVTLTDTEPLPRWIPLQRLANQAQGHCLGAKGINLLMSEMQNRLIDHGYVTTRVLAPQQDLNRGTLALHVVPGKIRHVALTPESDRHVTLFTTFPARAGHLLDLRDIEQGLENLQRIPTVQASMELIPGDAPGETDIALSWKQSKIWRLAASLDDSGTRSTGRYQGGATLFLDNPLSLSDQFYVSAGGSIKNRGEKGTNNLTSHYSLPFGYWTAGITASSYDYHQTVAGLNGDYHYRGESDNVTLQLSRLLHRNASQKTTFTYDVLTRSSKNYINDTEVEVQRRRTSAWRVGLQHRHFIAQSTLDAGISYQRGTRWFGAVPAQEEYFGEATALSKILRLNAQLDVPFALATQQFHYNLQYQRQSTNTPLTPQDQFSIGGRWTVRGFDGERTLNADRGWTVRNDLGWYTPLPGHELYVGVDYGEVGGRSDPYLMGHHLAGSVVGVRGKVLNTHYDLFAGKPLSKPEGFKTDSVTMGFSLNWQY
ncbi:TPA: ShlB/FhaC/HecB family hemolysin secretion/activation protein [Yersinia enterocolitica]|uniref:ShlB/FhaC/HecB family hemolysin secretion/activation protein n=1 Tax=Yersinia enterocolitica TaxID=630 RepID=UPI0005E5FC3B|nr:ShlB/FhaC/HecB family hemolysin secretion/activation protein [Yersinia enterocolitica]AOF17110.1 hemolysin transporter [Yersinia enterocolitica]CFV32368.1 putative hemolysin activator protein [Yersinia enterocolitica]CNF99663.1 putative hemolysin activator protein [Yersinia enterocolitica]HDL6967760.1 ShlB/FhaC/HecB family hemolysin secretion/activation protein [Yersinia enterocolitica]HDL6972044.1 ShlB/FhaC/HecB family hemolysin secretion/activation protein [Yersinia enterocolitica]